MCHEFLCQKSLLAYWYGICYIRLALLDFIGFLLLLYTFPFSVSRIVLLLSWYVVLVRTKWPCAARRGLSIVSAQLRQILLSFWTTWGYFCLQWFECFSFSTVIQMHVWLAHQGEHHINFLPTIKDDVLHYIEMPLHTIYCQSLLHRFSSLELSLCSCPLAW